MLSASSFTELPDEVKKFILVKLPISDIIHLCSSDRYLSRMCDKENIWEIIAEREYHQYLPALGKKNRWREIVQYLAIRRILPVYIRDKIIGWVIISPTDTIKDLINILQWTLTILTSHDNEIILPKDNKGLPIIDTTMINRFITTNEEFDRRNIFGLITTPTTQSCIQFIDYVPTLVLAKVPSKFIDSTKIVAPMENQKL